MFFSNPWGLLGLLSLPAILAIHLYQRRFPVLPVAGVHLWGIETELHQAGRKRDRLPISSSLLLEILAAALLTTILSQPRLGAAGTTTHLVIVLDNSASMSAAPKGGSSFRDTAVKQLESRFSHLGSDAVITLILTGRRPTVLAGPAVPWREGLFQLRDWKPTAPRHDFQSAWNLAAQHAGDSGRLLFLTDRLPSETALLPKRMEVVSVGRPVENVGFVAARWSLEAVPTGADRKDVRYQGVVFLRVQNFCNRPVDIVVRGRTEDARHNFETKTISLSAGGAESITRDVPGGVGHFDFTLKSTADGMAMDSAVTLLEPRIRTLKVAVTLPENSVAYRHVQNVLRILPDLRPVPAESAQLIIGPAGELPPSREGLWWLGIGPYDTSLAAKKTAVNPSRQFPFSLRKRDPLLDDITFNGVDWGGVQELKLLGTPLVSCGGWTLLSRLRGTLTVAYLLNIDLETSTLAQSGDWPILLESLINIRRKKMPGLHRWNFRRGEPIEFELRKNPTDSASLPLTLVRGKTTRPLRRGRTVVIPPLTDTGRYEVQDGGTMIARFAVNFLDERESNLSRLAPGRRFPGEESARDGFLLDQPQIWLTLAVLVTVLALLLTNWRSLQPAQSDR